jgi:hypothetical protein
MSQKELKDQLIDPKVREDLLKRFHNSFEKAETGIPFYSDDEGVDGGGWMMISFKAYLNADQLIKVSKFIKEKFSVPGTFPLIGVSRGGISIIALDTEVQRIADEGKI